MVDSDSASRFRQRITSSLRLMRRYVVELEDRKAFTEMSNNTAVLVALF